MKRIFYITFFPNGGEVILRNCYQIWGPQKFQGKKQKQSENGTYLNILMNLELSVLWR